MRPAFVIFSGNFDKPWRQRANVIVLHAHCRSLSVIKSLSVRAHKAMEKANPDVGLLQFLSSDEEDAYESRRKAALQPKVQALRDDLAAHATNPNSCR